MPSIPVPVLGFLFVSFRPSQFRSHSCSTGASLLFRFRFSSGLSPSLPVSFVPFCSGSDYSAFCSSFPLFPVSPLSGFPGARFRFRFFAFPFLPGLISHAFLPGSRTRLSVCFLSPFPDSLPTAVPQVLPLRSRPRDFPLPFRFLSSPSVPPPATQPSASSFLPSGPSPHSWLSVQAPVSFVPVASPLHPRLVSRPLPSGSAYSAFCSFPFVLPSFAPTAVPLVLPFWISPRGSTPDFRWMTSASVLASHYSASVSSFPPSLLPPHSGFRSSRLRSRFPGFPFLSGPISRAFLPGSRTRLPVRFLSSFLASLPQLFHECLPSAFAFGLFPFLPVSFVPFSSGSDYSASCFFLSLSS